MDDILMPSNASKNRFEEKWNTNKAFLNAS